MLESSQTSQTKVCFFLKKCLKNNQASSCFLINRFLWHSAKGPSRKAKLSFIIAVYDHSDQPFVGAAVLSWHPVNFAIAKLLCVVLQKFVAKGSMRLKVLKWIQSCKVKKTLNNTKLHGLNKNKIYLVKASIGWSMNLWSDFRTCFAHWMCAFFVKPQALRPFFVHLVECALPRCIFCFCPTPCCE